VEIFNNEKPFIEACFQFVNAFLKFWHFQINESQFVVENFPGYYVRKFYIVPEFIRIIFIFIKNEIQNSDCINLFEFKIPLAAGYCLVSDRKCGVINRSVFEKFLLGFLQLDNEFFAPFVGAIKVENRLPVKFGYGQIFTFQIS